MPSLSPVCSRPAHAKLNLALSVGSPVPPKGYHPIASWMTLLELADTVEFLPAGPGLTHEVRWAPDAASPSPIDWPVEQDLAVRAFELVRRVLPDVRVRVTKRIPVGGGLGGGSSDAAAVLLLARQLAPSLTNAELLSCASELGSDVPFFILAEDSRGPAIVTGFGERVEPAPAIGRAVAVDLVLPPFGCPTPQVYRRFDLIRPESRDPNVAAVHSLVNTPFDPSRLFNDLEPAAAAEFPPIKVCLELIRLSGRHALLAGSGSTIASFGSPLPNAPDGCRLVRTAFLA